ncbi:MAG: glycosyltransferase family 2 protein [Candidatus Wolfebacteria bacterium]|nr:glycosyltransferase family 2 protein [Candidatus Wolfebacteria bacterium]
MLKVSITTTVFNNRKYIASAIESVLSQTYPDIEYIVKDAGSTDGTVDIVKKYLDKISKFVSEKDRGIYDGMNQAIRLATGDIIGNLNSDDFYADKDVIKKVVEKMEETGADVCWGDLVYVDRDNPSKITRFWKSSEYSPKKFRRGWMPPHPTFFVRRKIYEKYGLFNTSLKISADYELMLRLLEKHKVKSCYIPGILVKMRQGGKSNRNILRQVQHHIEDYKAWKLNGFRVNPISIILKPLSKISQYFKKQ